MCRHSRRRESGRRDRADGARSPPWICPPPRDAVHGEDLLAWAWDRDPAQLALATRLVLDAVARLHSLTEPLSRDPVRPFGIIEV
jgi:hypothetical protein